MEANEKSPLLPLTSIEASPLRWWMCFVLSAIAFEQGMVWNTYGPIAPAIQDMLGWSDGTIALLANWVRPALMSSFSFIFLEKNHAWPAKFVPLI